MRYVGEPVAAVFAADPYVAEDAADLVEVDIDPLPVVLDAAAQPGPFDAERGTETTIIEKESGDIDAAFRAADMTVELDLRIGRHSGVPLETRGAIARYDEANDILEMHGAAKVPHWNRDRLALMFGPRQRERFSFTRAMSAAVSASAAKCIRRMCWFAPPR